MSPRSRSSGLEWVLWPPFVWLVVFFLVPFAIVLKISLSEPATAQPPYRPHFAPTLDPAVWRSALDALGFSNFATLWSEDLYLNAAISSLSIAAVSTLLLLALAFPIALAMARAEEGWRPVLLALVVVPFWTSLLVRVYAWTAILAGDGPMNGLLLVTGLIQAPVQLLNTTGAVLVGIVYAYLPFMILPLYASLERQDPALLDAAADLGASPTLAFWTVTAPLSWPGIAAGSLLCFIPIVGEFIIPDLLGGSETLMLGRVLWSEFFSNRDWPLAAAVAIVITVILVGPILVFRSVEARRSGARA